MALSCVKNHVWYMSERRISHRYRSGPLGAFFPERPNRHVEWNLRQIEWPRWCTRFPLLHPQFYVKKVIKIDPETILEGNVAFNTPSTAFVVRWKHRLGAGPLTRILPPHHPTAPPLLSSFASSTDTLFILLYQFTFFLHFPNILLNYFAPIYAQNAW